MKRRPTRRSFDRAEASPRNALVAAIDRIVAGYLDHAANDRLRDALADGSLAPAELTRQAIATAFRLTCRTLEPRTRENADPVAETFSLDQALCHDLARDLAVVFAEIDDRALDADVLGDLASWVATTPLPLDERVRHGEAERARAAGGSFYTPSTLVERLLDLTLEPLLEEATAHAEGAEAALLQLAILDPTCGSGRFLFAAAERIARRLVAVRADEASARVDSPDAALRQARADVFERCLFGVDIDPVAIELARFRVRRAIIQAGREPTTFERRFALGDALLGIDWDGTFAGVLFDLIVGNPPWTSYSGRHRGGADREYVARLVARYPCVARWPSLHAATVALAARLVRPSGRVGFVLPLRVADLPAYAPFREHAAKTLRLTKPVEDAGEAAFADVRQPAGLFAFVAESRDQERSPVPWPIEREVTEPSAARRASASSEDARLDEALARLTDFPRFPAKTFGDPGVHTGNAAKKLILVEPLPDSDCVPIREGRDVAAYSCGPPHKYVRLDVALAQSEYCRVGQLDRFLKAPILVRQTANRPVAARHVGPTYFRNSLLACRAVPGIPELVIVALLNSALFALLHRRRAADAAQRTFPQIKVRALQDLPCPAAATFDRRDGAGSLADRLVEAATLAERSVARDGSPSIETLERIERFVLRSFDHPEDLAPLLLAAANERR